MNNRVLVVGAHPDDEVLGCGGTMAWHAARGDTVHVLLVADGEAARGADDHAIAGRRGAAVRAAAALGAEPPRFLNLPDQRLDSLDLLDLTQSIEAEVREVRPTVVYTHHAGDLNLDHRLVAQAVITACRPLPSSPLRRLLAFETASSTEWTGGQILPAFHPTVFVAIAPFLDAKRKALEAYADEMRPFPHARSNAAITALEQWRGASAGMNAAESFALIRELLA